MDSDEDRKRENMDTATSVIYRARLKIKKSDIEICYCMSESSDETSLQ